ncbi:MAG: hypothetical protein E7535_04490 [Ruminococcaceae bacterium]|nr:hypothetical protein [Oscillospiraceae bacterium]
MNNSKYDTMKYIGAAVAIGGTMLLGSGLMSSNKSMKKKMKKTANKALDAVDGILTGMQHIVK